MDIEAFEILVSQAVESLPLGFREKLDNVDVVVEVWPQAHHYREVRVHPRSLLLGLYQGTPKTKRTSGTFFPDKITIFAGPILSISRSPDEVERTVQRVVKHEIGHHFGMDERAIRKIGY